MTVGERAWVGANAVLEPGSILGPDAVLGEQSASTREQVVAERASTGPGRRRCPSRPTRRRRAHRGRPGAVLDAAAARSLAAAGVLVLEMLAVLSLLPAVLLVWGSLLVFGEGPALAVAVGSARCSC